MDNRIILVTGANRGIGLATVQALASNQNDTILLGCRDLQHGTAEAEKIGTNVKAVAMDLGSRDTLTRDIESLLNEQAKIDVLINNAGIYEDGNALDTDLDAIERSLQVNTVAVIQLTQAIVPGMIERGYGRIVNVSSGYGLYSEGLAGPFAYSLSKAALNAVTVKTAQELPANVKVNAVCPGWVHTRMGGAAAPRTPEQGAAGLVWLANLPADGPSGLVFRDDKALNW